MKLDSEQLIWKVWTEHLERDYHIRHLTSTIIDIENYGVNGNPKHAGFAKAVLNEIETTISIYDNYIGNYSDRPTIAIAKYDIYSPNWIDEADHLIALIGSGFRLTDTMMQITKEMTKKSRT